MQGTFALPDRVSDGGLVWGEALRSADNRSTKCRV